jgi:UDPglucose 6-dehydrogenase
VTEWNEFRQLDLVALAKELKARVLFDGRNIYEPETVKKLGFTYYGIGRM